MKESSFYYAYILQSETAPNRYYTGFTEDLQNRLKYHNSGQCPHTSKYKPWRIKTAIAFTDRKKALDFESYLKTPSGRAFAKSVYSSAEIIKYLKYRSGKDYAKKTIGVGTGNLNT